MMDLPEKWTAAQIARTILLQQFSRKMLVLVPNCSWTGNECDLLCVTQDMRIVDVEIKISRDDLRRDMKKEKWFHRWNFKTDGYDPAGERVRHPRQWPEKVWKHYYAVPKALYDTGIEDLIPAASGILVLDTVRGRRRVDERRRAVPDRKADRLCAEDAVDIARLAGLRMWDAMMKLEGCEVRAKRFEEAKAA